MIKRWTKGSKGGKGGGRQKSERKTEDTGGGETQGC